MKEAYYYQALMDGTLQCKLCPHECHIGEGKHGICRVRENHQGKLYSTIYDSLAAIAIDPIEKKPLRRYKPGSRILSVGTVGCNFRCKFCQNYHISQQKPPVKGVTVDELLELSAGYNDSIGIAFTYNEPTVWYEYVYEVAQRNPKDTILVTNGYINPQPLEHLLPYVDAMNIDLKSINDAFYTKVCGGRLSHVQRTIATAHEETHVEITFLAIPGKNDSPEEMKSIAAWIRSIDEEIPLHIIPFRPMYQMEDVPYQSLLQLSVLKQIARQELEYVY